MDDGWPMLTGSIILISLTKDGISKSSICIHFLETMEIKSLKRNLALKITILHLLRDPKKVHDQS